MRHYASIDGVRLEVPELWLRLSPADREACCNGIGPDDWPAWRRRALGALLPWMVAASKPHDVRYSLPQTDAERAYADAELLRNWVRSIKHRLNWHWWCWAIPVQRERYLGCLALARLAYRGVRIAGEHYARRGDGK